MTNARTAHARRGDHSGIGSDRVAYLFCGAQFDSHAAAGARCDFEESNLAHQIGESRVSPVGSAEVRVVACGQAIQLRRGRPVRRRGTRTGDRRAQRTREGPSAWSFADEVRDFYAAASATSIDRSASTSS